jgi:hypothetical protein
VLCEAVGELRLDAFLEQRIPAGFEAAARPRREPSLLLERRAPGGAQRVVAPDGLLETASAPASDLERDRDAAEQVPRTSPHLVDDHRPALLGP